MNSILEALSGRNGLERRAQALLCYSLEHSPDFYRSLCREVGGREFAHRVAEESREEDLRFDLRLGLPEDCVSVELKCWSWFTWNQAADLRADTRRIGAAIVPAARLLAIKQEFPKLTVLSWDDVVRLSQGTPAELVLRGLDRYIDFGCLAGSDDIVSDMRAFAAGGAGDAAGHVYRFLCYLDADLATRLGPSLTQSNGWSITAAGGPHGWPYYGYKAKIVIEEQTPVDVWIGFYTDQHGEETYLVLQLLGRSARTMRAARAAGADANNELQLWSSAEGRPVVLHHCAMTVQETVTAILRELT